MIITSSLFNRGAYYHIPLIIIRQWVLGRNYLNYKTIGDILFLWIEDASLPKGKGAVSRGVNLGDSLFIIW
jgi:hypothetical protein